MSGHFISYFSRRCDSISFQLAQIRKERGADHGLSRTLRWAASTAASDGGWSRKTEERTAIETGQGSGAKEEGCAFCEIAAFEQDAFRVFEDEHCVAFLDLLPIRPGHLLVIPKAHFARVSHLPDEVAASLGRVLPRISRALCAAMKQPDFNIVSNQGYAQIVHHVHFHLVPAPMPDDHPRSGWAAIIGRDELDDDEAEEIAGRIRAELARETEVDRSGGQGKAKL